MAASTCNADSGLVAHDLRCNHGQSLALCGVDLARHDAATRLVLREAELTKATARAGTEVTNVVGDLHQGARNDVEGTMRFYKGIVGGQGLELIGSSLELNASELRNFNSNFDIEALPGVKTLRDCKCTVWAGSTRNLQSQLRYHPEPGG